MTQRIGLFGGTFDPVHIGHMNACRQIVAELDLSSLAMIPAFQPVHKQLPDVTSEHRLEMLSLACENDALITCDDREIRRGGPSYTLLTLKEYRIQHPQACLYFIMGMDALNTFDSWYHWQEFLDYSNLIIVERPGLTQNFSNDIKSLLDKFTTESISSLQAAKSGLIYCSKRAMLEFSSTEVRQSITNPDEISRMLPEKVLNYIHDHKLYR